MKDTFISCINNKCHVEVTFNSNEKGLIVRNCVPFDYGPSRKYKDELDRFHFYDLDSPEGKHNLSILPEQLVSLKALEQVFNPGDYVTWRPNWFIQRDWGIHS